MAQHTESFSLFPGVGEMLERLAGSGVQMAVVSSNSRENVVRILGPGNAGHISHFACGASLFGKGGKLREVLRRISVRGAEAIYLGDEVRDAEAAARAGIAFGAVTWGLHEARTLAAQKPAHLFTSVRAIADTLCG
jgi:phosphoglycolate phosphatase